MSAAKTFANKTLAQKLVDLIRIRGSMTVADYMRVVLTNPATGFYMNDDVFGVKGHFTTSPEISQIFGEVLGAWICHEWRRFGSPKPLRLVEFGPGRGTLMCDITRTINKLESAPTSIQIRMIEMSPHLRDIQQKSLQAQSLDLVGKVQWHTHVDAIPESETKDGFTAFIAHEFLDALPIHKFVREQTANKWRELLIDYDKEEQLRFCIARKPTLSTRLLIPEDFSGSHIEVCPEAALSLEKVANHLNNSQSGCMLICDYGFDDATQTSDSGDNHTAPANRDTFRAFKKHSPWPPLKSPGEADLTADVDFGYLKKHLQSRALVFGSTTQKDFLNKCGLMARLDRLLENTSGPEREELISGADLMLNEMGERYRFLAFFPKASEYLFDGDPPAGFSESN